MRDLGYVWKINFVICILFLFEIKSEAVSRAFTALVVPQSIFRREQNKLQCLAQSFNQIKLLLFNLILFQE